MIDLQKISGLSILFDERKLDLIFQDDFPSVKKSERSLEELRPYLQNPRAKQGPNPVYHVRSVASNVVYTVWRYVHLKKDEEKIKKANLRYDITLIPPGTINGEFAKTAGHYHLHYPEVYEVLMGQPYFLTQSKSAVFLAEVGPGEKFLIPPGFGHNTINVFDKPLLMANWVSEKAEYDYKPYKNNHGAMYYLLDDNNLIDIIKNPNYNSVPEIKKIGTREYPEFGILKSKPLYNLVNSLEKLRFLNYPEEFAGEWRNW